MKIRNQNNQQAISAAENILSSLVPELTQINLIKMLKNHNIKEEVNPQLERSLSYKALIELLGVSPIRISRHLKSSTLHRIKKSDKCFRVRLPTR